MPGGGVGVVAVAVVADGDGGVDGGADSPASCFVLLAYDVLS